MYVPHPVGSVRAALTERPRVTRCVPGLRQAADAPADSGAVEGRLRVRVGGSTITYRGSLEINALGDGFRVRGSGAEARGQGSVRLDLEVVPRLAADGTGTRLTCSGTVTGEGRIADIEPKVALAAGRRMLDRFASALAESLRTESASGSAADSAPSDSRSPADGTADAEINARRVASGDEPEDDDLPGIAGSDATAGSTPHEPASDDLDNPGNPDDRADPDDAAGAPEATGTPHEEPDPDRTHGPAPEDQPAAESADPEPSATEAPDSPAGDGIFDTDVPPPSLDPYADSEALDEEDIARSTAEAAHARRTMIGRSAEEVDHAPPRGRYAPEPLPETVAGSATLRWAAPAAALAVAGAIVLGRALRRRR
ncbi:hypothetical protein AN216_20450 [Streptomyces oceani]|uniref:Carbon monoxide dehydrogenase subunit G n=1 Tax=Streptomyces oceani TaxID=1075402 RepID=A0A1E7JXP0_9ACTN|nr:hypothetical protein AN216_20450 [Streptomyces oceani]